ncbi:MAG: flippase-like domain-containing protein [Polyangiaceae bacterium]|nr:flippase-like domain-containing protein [Polyangiaceae bacterium]
MLRHALNASLYLGGLALFWHLVRSSGVGSELNFEFSPVLALLLLAVSTLPSYFDAKAWQVTAAGLGAGAKKIPLAPLIWLRIAGEGVTNGVPGGLVFGETYKAVKLNEWFAARPSDTTPGLILMKLGLGYSQALFILMGMALGYSRIAAESEVAFGFAGVQWIVLALLVAMCAFMGIALVLFYLGRPFARVISVLNLLPQKSVKEWVERQQLKVKTLDENCSALIKGHPRELLMIMFWLMMRWFSMVGENLIILAGLQLLPSSPLDALLVAFVIESLGSMFRLIFFLVPSGIGGQDASYFALFQLYGWSAPITGAYIVVKRLKELFWIAAGFVLIFVTRFFSVQLSDATALPEEELERTSP